MRNSIAHHWRSISLLMMLVLVTPVEAARYPSDAVVGVRLGMSKEAAEERLRKIGRLAEGQDEESARKQQWRLSDRTYAHLVVEFDSAERVRWISAFARRGGRGIRFRDLGDLGHAQRRGAHIYVWSVPALGSRDPYQVIARGAGRDTLESLSLVKLPRGAK